MRTTSHRLKIEQKKLVPKLIVSFISLLTSFVLIIFVGIPFLAKVSIFFTSYTKNKDITDTTLSQIQSAPIFDPIFEATNSAKLTLSGYSQEDSTVIIYINNQEQMKVLTDNDGRFIAKNIILTEGKNVISGKSLKKQQESSNSTETSIFYKKTLPQLKITYPDNDTHIRSESNEMTIRGETESATKVTINDRQVFVDTQGKFNHLIYLNENENIYIVRAIDLAGNEQKVELNVSYTRIE